MKHLVLFFFLMVNISNIVQAQITVPKYPQKDIVLYRGGPSVTLESYGLDDTLPQSLPHCNSVWTDGGIEGVAGNLVNVYDFTASNTACPASMTFTSSAPVSYLDIVDGYWEIPRFNLSVEITTDELCEFTLREGSKMYRGRFYSTTTANIWHTPVLCKDTALIVHNVKIVDPIVFNSATTEICKNAARLDLRDLVNDPSGTFEGVGIEDQYYFNPALAEVGETSIKYIKDYFNFADYTVTLDILVNPVPVVSIGADQQVCKNQNLTLTGTPAGNWATNSYITGSVFSGTLAPVGLHEITYNVEDANGCKASAKKNITVKALPVVSAGDNITTCSNSPVITLSGSIPENGIWSENGTTITTFTPTTATIGVHQINYRFTDPTTQCSASDIKEITVTQAPIISLGQDTAVCRNVVGFQLKASPEGGSWSGEGILNGSTFSPSLSGAATRVLTYTVTKNACTSSANREILVHDIPEVNVVIAHTLCSNGPAISLEKGGVWSGETPGLSGSTFDPKKDQSSGRTVARYTVTDANNCSASREVTFRINTKPIANVAGTMRACVSQPTINLTGEQPKGGKWIGKGITGNTLQTSSYGVGRHNVQYVVIDTNKCSDTTSTTINILSLPVVSAGKDTSLCQTDGQLNLAINPGISPKGGKWTVSGVEVPASVLDLSSRRVGTYTAVYSLTDNNSCSNSDSIAIIINPVPEKPIVSGIMTYCKGSTIELSVPETTNSIRWRNSSNTVLANTAIYTTVVDTSLNLRVTYINNFKCSSLPTTVIVNVENVDGEIKVAKDSVDFSEGAEFTFIGDTSNKNFNWTFTNFAGKSIEASPKMYFYSEGYHGYSVTVTSPLGCTKTYTKDSSVYVRKYVGPKTPLQDNDTHNDNLYADFAVRLYPNPVASLLTIETLNGELVNPHYYLYNDLGVLIQEGSNYKQIEMATLASGGYSLILRGNKFNKSYRVIKQ